MNNQVKRIVCPVDFSEPSELALAQAVSMAEQTGAELMLTTVVQPITPAMFSDGMLLAQPDTLPNQSEELAQKLLDKWREKFCTPVLERTTLHVAVGIPFVEIVRHARENEADLIVMGSHGRTGIEHLMIGSVAERVVRKATCSVLVVRDANRRFTMP
jgi:nucleotide-binding universal stress UspA family protein